MCGATSLSPLLLCLYVEEMDNCTLAFASVYYKDDGLTGS
jgi:hypothetical protein